MESITGISLTHDGWPPRDLLIYNYDEIKVLFDLRRKCGVSLGIDHSDVRLWKLNSPVSPEDTVQQELIRTLNPTRLDTIASVVDLGDEIATYFPQGPGQQIVFVAAPMVDPRSERKRKVLEEEASPYFKRLRSMLSPSDFAKEHIQAGWDPLLLNHRPIEAEGLPTELLHPVFGRFRDSCTSIKPETRDVQLSLELIDAVSRNYASDELRLRAFRDSFQGQYGFRFDGITLSHEETNTTAIQGQFFIVNVEGTGDDPSLQNAAYYGKRLLEAEAARESRLPMFLLDITGSILCISAAILGAKITIDPLVPINLASSKHDLPKIVPIFAALRVALAELETYYGQQPLPIVPHGQLRYPYFDCIHDGNVKLAYTEDIIPGRLIFDAVRLDESADDRDVVVKFSRTYGLEAHRACADAGFAPKPIHEEELPGGWTVVVMERIKSPFRIMDDMSDKEREDLRPVLTEAVSELHKAGFVHGDIRRANIFGDPETRSIRIVDWDRAGREGDVHYPLLAIPRAGVGVQALEPVLKAHDMASLEAALVPGAERLY